jgi:predicted HicB family RNase H-like nuclease
MNITDNTMMYKDYTAVVSFSAEDECLVGHLIGINDIVGFHGDSVEEVRKAFEEAVDFYLESSAQMSHEANKPIPEVMVPIPQTLYARIAQKAEYDGIPINTVMETALQKFVQHA